MHPSRESGPPAPLADGVDAAFAAILFETAAAGVALVDRELRYVRVNAELAAMNGLPVEAHLGRRVQEVLPAAAADALEVLLRRVMETGEPATDLPFTLDEPGHPRRHFLSSYHPVRGPDGTVVGAAAFVAERTPAEAALREAEDLTRQLFALSPLPAFVYDRETLAILDANVAAVRRYGWSRDELLGMSLRDIRPPEDVPQLLSVAWRPQPVAGRRGTARHRTRDGEVFEVEVFSQDVERAGRAAGIVVMQDITERRRAEAAERATREALDAERARLDRIVAQMPAAISVMEGPELRVRATSAAYRRIVGDREIIGRPIREALPELSGGAGGTDFFELMSRVHADGETIVRTNEPASWDADGDGVAEPRIIDLVYAPLRRAGAADDGPADERLVDDGPVEDGPVDGVIALVLDVTTRARAETALRESEARFRTMADAAPVMLWVTEPDGRCTFLNRQWLDFTGQTLHEGLGFGWLEAVHPDDAPEAERVFRDAVERRTSFRIDYRLRRHDGVYRWAVDSAAPRLGPAGEYLGFIGSVLDIDERAQLLAAERAARAVAEAAVAEAERANRAKSEFLAVMSHELRTPLNAIQGYAELVELGIHGPVTPAQQDALRRIQTSQRHLLGLVNGVLNYARVETGNVHYALDDMPLGPVLVACEALLLPQARAKRIELAFPALGGGADAHHVAVHADPEKVQQILLNLIGNAVKFTEAGGRVAVLVEAAGAMVAIRVTDTGVGIAADQLERIFEPFVQVDARLTRAHEGVGLGLAISRDLARGMGGDITAASRPGAGSTFTLVLPLA